MLKNQIIMKIDFIPFQIGEDYENWEFDLDLVFNNKIYDQYHYYKNDIKELFQIPIDAIYLSFNFDVLFKVEYLFNANYFQELKTTLITIIGTGTFSEYHNKLVWENTKISLILELPRKSKKLYLKVIDKNFYEYL